MPSRKVRDDYIPFRELPSFDPSVLSADAQAWFDNVQSRIREAAESMIHAYRPADSALTIHGCYKHTTTFNAAAWQEDDRLTVGVGAAVPILLEMLFWAMLADPDVLPRLPSGTRTDAAKAVFAVDPRDSATLSQYEASLSDERAAWRGPGAGCQSTRGADRRGAARPLDGMRKLTERPSHRFRATREPYVQPRRRGHRCRPSNKSSPS